MPTRMQHSPVSPMPAWEWHWIRHGRGFYPAYTHGYDCDCDACGNCEPDKRSGFPLSSISLEGDFKATDPLSAPDFEPQPTVGSVKLARTEPRAGVSVTADTVGLIVWPAIMVCGGLVWIMAGIGFCNLLRR